MAAERARGDDGELARAARHGSRAAYSALVERYQRPLFRFLRMRANSAEDAEELLQDTFLRGWTRLQQFDPERDFSAWIYTLAARLAVSLRRRPRLPAATERELDGLTGPLDPAALAERNEQRANLWDVALRVLGAEPRTALWLFYGENRSAREIGSILDRREDAVRAMLVRARQRLAPHLPRPALCQREQ